MIKFSNLTSYFVCSVQCAWSNFLRMCVIFLNMIKPRLNNWFYLLMEFVQCILGFPIGIPLCAIARNCLEWRGINWLAIALEIHLFKNLNLNFRFMLFIKLLFIYLIFFSKRDLESCLLFESVAYLHVKTIFDKY